MKKILLLFFAIITTFQSVAQDPAIIDTWYLTEMTVDLGPSSYVSNVQPAIAPHLIIDSSFAFTGEAACNSYFGNFGYDPINDFLLIDSFDATLSTCSFPSHDNFEVEYFSYFGGTEAAYFVGTSGSDSYLILETGPGYELIYQDTPLLSVGDVNKPRFIVYPNPSSDFLFIASENMLIESAAIYDLNGRLVVSEVTKSKIEISSLIEGMYFIEVTSSEGKSVQKFIKE